MRLTLRTLLAYLDDQLARKDAEEIGTKIEKSDFAQRLQRRIRMLLNRRNISAPKVLMHGIGDPNLVAEYLDSTLPPDQVADFEKICLESDIHLAEVAACHQILISLGRSESIASELRQRIYRLNKFPIDEAHIDADSDSDTVIEKHGDIQEQFVDSLAEKIVPGHDIFELSAPSHHQDLPWDDDQKDELKGSAPKPLANKQRRVKVLPILAAVASIMLLALLIVYATRDLGKPTASQGSTKQEDAAKENSDGNEGFDEQAFKDLEKLSPQSAGKDSDQFPDSADKKAPDTANEEKQPSNVRTETVPVPPADNSPKQEIDNRKVIEISFDDIKPLGKIDAGNDPARLGKAELLGFEVQAVGEAVASLDTGTNLLARLDAGSDAWTIVPGESPIKAHEILLTFPFFRPQMIFGGVKVTACGAGAAQVLPVSEKNVAGLLIQSGRFLFQTAEGKGFSEFRIQVGDVSGSLTLADQQSVLALEVVKYLPPGIDPESEEASQQGKTIVQISGVAGRGMWGDQRDVMRLEKGDVKVYVSGQQPRSGRMQSEPNWTAGDAVSDFELADKDLLYSLASRGATIEAALLDALKADTFTEAVRARLLAQICLLQLGDGPSLVALLDDPAPVFTRLWVGEKHCPPRDRFFIATQPVLPILSGN